jgi:5-methylcytosine-specific restriction endonuclease McrBC GTP-binding regulatory subunit McrB
VTSIGKDAFYGCDKLPPDIKERIRSINEDAYLPDTIRDNNEDDNKNENKYKDENKKERLPRLPKPENKIFYGVPGSGKSHAIRSKIGEEKYEKFLDRGNIIRVVFHPDYTYSDFTGQILPRVGDNGAISYEFKPGPFTKILKAAVEREDEPFFLVIEEVNRGNAASIFGDLFQLLDRDDEGKSEYPVDNHEIGKIVYGKGDDDADIPKIHIPANLWLLATMNTSDQNVFALDTAFQRRWDMELIPNEFGEGQEFLIEGTGVTWGKFAKEVNGVLEEDDNGMMGGDKRLGAWFVKPDKKIDGKDALSRGRFANKVLKYLWDDAFKFNRDAFFNTEKYKTLEAVIKAVSDNDNVPDDLFKGINFDSP